MTRKWVILLALLTAGVLMAGVAAASETLRITKEEVKAKLSSADMAIIDVRASRDWKKSESMIKGAVREDPKDVEKWAKNYPKGKTLVLYCA